MSEEAKHEVPRYRGPACPETHTIDSALGADQCLSQGPIWMKIFTVPRKGRSASGPQAELRAHPAGRNAGPVGHAGEAVDAEELGQDRRCQHLGCLILCLDIFTSRYMYMCKYI